MRAATSVKTCGSELLRVPRGNRGIRWGHGNGNGSGGVADGRGEFSRRADHGEVIWATTAGPQRPGACEVFRGRCPRWSGRTCILVAETTVGGTNRDACFGDRRASDRASPSSTRNEREGKGNADAHDNRDVRAAPLMQPRFHKSKFDLDQVQLPRGATAFPIQHADPQKNSQPGWVPCESVHGDAPVRGGIHGWCLRAALSISANGSLDYSGEHKNLHQPSGQNICQDKGGYCRNSLSPVKTKMSEVTAK